MRSAVYTFGLLNRCRASLFIVFLVIGLMANPYPALGASAGAVDLYHVQSLVLDQSLNSRRQAAATALATVVVRVSGDTSARKHPQVQSALKRVESYLAKYSYESSNETITIAGDQKPAYRLLMQFSRSAVRDLLSRAQLPLWPESRPKVLLWVASNNPQISLLDSESAVVNAFKRAGVERGLPIINPLLDLTDRQRLSVQRLWAMDESSIHNASSRYPLDAILAGKLRQERSASKSAWSANFLLLYGDRRHTITAFGNTQAIVAKQVVDQLASYFAERDALLLSGQQSLPTMALHISNIGDFQSYTRLLSYLDSLSMVTIAIVRELKEVDIIVELTYNGELKRMLSQLRTSGLLEGGEKIDLPTPVTVPLSSSVEKESQPAFAFRWR